MQRIIKIKLPCCGACPFYVNRKCQKGARELIKGTSFYDDCPLEHEDKES